MKRILIIAASDSGAGAGIQADLKTCMALGCYATTALTALTAQNTQSVRRIFPVDPGFVVDQIEAILEDIGVDSIKIGMLFNSRIIEAVAQTLKKINIPIILDPVMISQSGHSLLEPDAILAMREYLFPQALLITPNLDEAKFLVGEHDAQITAQKILSMGPKAVLIKGGHRNQEVYTEAQDYLLSFHEGVYFSSPWIQTPHTHGTGCTLSSAIACYTAQGFDLVSAISQAKSYLTGALHRGLHQKIGLGAGPVCHDWRFL